jgi:peptidoglycan/LPS O-acetylase OafA/YrhL
MNPLTKHVAALDGLRALSIVFVIYAHLSFANSIPRAIHATSLGLSGVIIFFVISGYLITLQLLREKRNTQSIHIGYFVLRRAFRLFPACFLLIFVSWMLSYLGYVPLEKAALWHALTYTMDYYHPSSAVLQHLWSLSVEEQFYLLWPFVVLFASFQRSKTILIAVLVVCPLLRAWGWYFGGVEQDLIFRRFDMIADCLGWGCLLANVEDRLPKWTSSSATVLVSLFIILGLGVFMSRVPASAIIATSVLSVCAVLIVHSLTSQSLWISRCFAWAPFAWLGTVSYSLYLWQELFTLHPPPHIDSPIYSKIFVFPYNLAGALVAATLSFYLLEKPVRAWGSRFRPARKGVAAKMEVAA